MGAAGLLPLLGLSLCSGSLCANGKLAYQLLRDLFANSSSALRPVQNTDQALNVTLQITLSQIIDMDERNQILTTYLWIRQVWKDAFRHWNKDDYDGIDAIRIPSSYVWRPDIVVYNSADDQFTSSVETNLVLRHDGQITWDSPAITRTSCKVNVSFFPFDGQQCPLTFGSWTYNGNQIDLLSGLGSGDLSDFLEHVEWEVLGMPARRNVIMYGCCAEPYPDVTFTLLLRRRSSFYVYNLLLPCVMISSLAPLSFYLPAGSGEKVSLGVTVLLALTVFQLQVAEIMPPSENVPLIGKYYIVTMTMITASTALTILIMNIHHCGPEAKPVPQWAKVVILRHMARALFVYEVGENCASGVAVELDGQHDLAAIGHRPGGEEEEEEETEEETGGEGREEPEQISGSSASLGNMSSNCYHAWQEAKLGLRTAKGTGGHRGCGRSCLHHRERLIGDIKFIANCFRRQRAARSRTAEWKKVAKVMDRFFMWFFVIMVFFMSVFIAANAL